MKTNTTFILSAILALLLAAGYSYRITSQRQDFDREVRKAQRTTAGYDKEFIGMVNRLEKELTNRASFGYTGGKDPMTGRIRRVVTQAAPAANKAVDSTAAVDPVKLTAIIFDDKNKRYMAIVMDGERSYSLEVDDQVRNRVVRKITDDVILMEGDSLLYMYDIFGKSSTKRK